MNTSTVLTGCTLLALAGPLVAGALNRGTPPDRAATPGPGLTIYTGNLGLVRLELKRRLEPGDHTVTVDGLPTNLDRSSLIVVDPAVTLLGAHGFRSYRDAVAGPGASIDLDLRVRARVDRLRLAFLTDGLSWSADYAMIVAPNDATARVDGYATLSNGSGTGYEAAEIQLLAGTIQRGGAGVRDQARFRAMEAAVQAPQLERAAFADYHLYTVSAPLSLHNGESRRIRLLGVREVKTAKLYTFSYSASYHRPQPEPVSQPALVSYRLERQGGEEFSDTPLPGGEFRVYRLDGEGRLQLLGIDAIPNTPAGEALSLTVGRAFDVVGTRTQTDYRRVEANAHESEWKVELHNGSDASVTVQVIERLSGDWRIVESSHTPEKLAADAVRFRVRVPAGDRTVLNYRVVSSE